MKVGFTGTQTGMTPGQINALGEELKKHTISEFHHGDCIGADAQAHEIASSLGVTVVIHPPENPAKRAFKNGTLRNPKPYLDRNHDIVDEADILIVAPSSNQEKLRSGTWATCRYARKTGTKFIVLWR